jgi:hypothetical protein
MHRNAPWEKHHEKWIHTGAMKPDAAKALAKFPTSPSAAVVIKKNGTEPG